MICIYSTTKIPMKKVLLSVIAVLLLLMGCSSIETASLSSYDGRISFYENSADYYQGDKIMKCLLSDTASLNGYMCVSWIWFFEDGRIKQFRTAQDMAMDDFVIPANSTIFFSESNHDRIEYIWFSKDVTIHDISCKGGGKISTEFYDNGSLKACFLTKDLVIQGFPCESSLTKPEYFYPDGRIKILTLSADFKCVDTDFKKGESIMIDEDGTASVYKR